MHIRCLGTTSVARPGNWEMGSFLMLSWAVLLLWRPMPLWAQTGPSEIEDRDIEAAIAAELVRDEVVAGDMIDVACKDGVVTLSGSVCHLLARDQALEIAERTRGVRAVVNTIQVRPVLRSDDEIQADVQQVLRLDPATDSYEVDVDVQGARVTLKGRVNSRAEKQLTAKLVKTVRGVAEIRNHIKIAFEEERFDSEIEAEVIRCFELDPSVDSRRVRVEVDDGEISLTGSVGSVYEKSQATQLAWVNGVERVDTRGLSVSPVRVDPMTQSPYGRFESDHEIEAAVTDALSYDARVDASMVQVESSSGTVVLTGIVDHLEAKKAAEQDVENALGVWRVENRLKVRPVNPPSDEYIHNQIKDSLARDVVLEPYVLTALVRNQKVYLYGEVATYHARNRAAAVVGRVFGVAAVANHIKVVVDSTSKTDAQVKEEIEDQYFWNIFVDGGDIRVDVKDGVATLQGSVDSWHELKAAVEDAFQAGAEGVENKLLVRDTSTQVYPQQYYPSLFWGM